MESGLHQSIELIKKHLKIVFWYTFLQNSILIIFEFTLLFLINFMNQCQNVFKLKSEEKKIYTYSMYTQYVYTIVRTTFDSLHI